MSDKPMLEIAYEFVSQSTNPVTFKALWAYVIKEKGLTEEEASKKVSQFYTTLLLDGRFVTLGENTWDLRSRQKFDKVHIDMRDVYSDVESSDDDPDEAEEEKQYNEAFEEKVIDRKEEGAPESDEESESEEKPVDPYNA